MRSTALTALSYLAPLLLTSRSCLAQDVSPTPADEATTVSMALAEVVTPEPTQALLPAETLQLTDNVLVGLNETELDLFAFEDYDTTVDGVARLRRQNAACKVFPGDAAWPIKIIWDLFDVVLGGALLQPKPKARVCWGDTLDQAACDAITAEWANSYSLLDDPIETFNPEYQGMTCQPPSFQYPYITTCTQGGYPVYVVKATNVAQIQLAVNFARATGIRLVVKNTGHDFMGKSLGAGALSIWTHYLKDTLVIRNYRDSYYRGPAIKAGAGAQAFELYKFAADNNLAIVAGEGQTVGAMGGYIQGGGHSPLSSLYGMAADQVLAFEVVTATGRFVRASSDENQDLYWALRGGGGGTFGVVTSVTVKAYPDIPTTTATFTIMQGGNVTADAFWAGVSSFVKRFPEFTKAGTYSYFFIYPNFATGVGHMFIMQPFFFPNMTLSASQALLAPWLAELATLGINVTPEWKTYSSFYPAWQNGFPLERINNAKAVTSSRLLPASLWTDSTKLTAATSLLRSFAETGNMVIGFHMATARKSFNAPNAVNSAFRDSLSHLIFVNSWAPDAQPAAIKQNWESFSLTKMQQWRDLTPGGGAYLNEADALEPNWQQAFYGSNYARLNQIKKAWDPRQLFWVRTGVGSEGWNVRSENGLANENGRLCRV